MYIIRMKEIRKGRTIKNRVIFASPDRQVCVSRMKDDFDNAILEWSKKYALETGYDTKDHSFWAIPFDIDRCIKVFLVEP